MGLLGNMNFQTNILISIGQSHDDWSYNFFWKVHELQHLILEAEVLAMPYNKKQ